MALVSCSGVAIPSPLWSNATGTTGFVIDAANKQAAIIVPVPRTGTITAVAFRTITVTFGGGSALSVGLETVSTADGNPTGTAYGGSAAGSQSGVVANTWYEVTLATPANANAGDLVAIVIKFSAFTAGDSVLIGRGATSSSQPTPVIPYHDLYNGTSWTKSTNSPYTTLKYQDGDAYSPIPYCMPNAPATAAFNSGSANDQRALKFQLPMSARVVGWWAPLATVAGGDFEVDLLDSSSTVLATHSYDGDQVGATGAYASGFFNAPVTLQANTWYRLVFKATTATNLTIYECAPGAGAGAMLALPLGSNAYRSIRSGTGAWTDATGSRPVCGVLIDQIDVSVDALATTVAAAVLTTPANKLATDSSGRVTVGSNADKTGYGLAADQSAVTVGAVNTAGALGTTAKSDVAAAVLATPSQKLATDGSGRVTVGANADKSGYSLAEGHGLALAGDLAVVDANVDAIVGKLPVGALADSSEVTAIQNNTLAVRVVPPVMERPDSGSRPYRLELYLYDEAGHMEAPDSAPEVHVINQAGTSRDANLESTTMTLISTGHYRALYTVAFDHDTEELVFTFTVVEGGSTRQYGNAALVADTTAVDFTASDRSDLQTMKADVAAVLADTGTAGVVVDTYTAGAQSEIKAQAASALSDYDPPTKAEVDASLAGLHDLSPTEAQAAAAAALDGYDPPTKSEMDAGFAGLDDPSASEIATAVVNIDLSSYEAAARNGAKLGNMVAAARAGALGRLELSETTLTLYEVDGSTILARFTVAEDYSSRSAPS
jgi:hypothetical protein